MREWTDLFRKKIGFYQSKRTYVKVLVMLHSYHVSSSISIYVTQSSFFSDFAWMCAWPLMTYNWISYVKNPFYCIILLNAASIYVKINTVFHRFHVFFLFKCFKRAIHCAKRIISVLLYFIKYLFFLFWCSSKKASFITHLKNNRVIIFRLMEKWTIYSAFHFNPRMRSTQFT